MTFPTFLLIQNTKILKRLKLLLKHHSHLMTEYFKFNMPMPIASAMESVLFHGADPKDKVKELMTRDLKKEKAY